MGLSTRCPSEGQDGSLCGRSKRYVAQLARGPQILGRQAEVCPNRARLGRIRPNWVESGPTLAEHGASPPSPAKFGPEVRCRPKLTLLRLYVGNCRPILAELSLASSNFGPISANLAVFRPVLANGGPNLAQLGQTPTASRPISINLAQDILPEIGQFRPTSACEPSSTNIGPKFDHVGAVRAVEHGLPWIAYSAA